MGWCFADALQVWPCPFRGLWVGLSEGRAIGFRPVLHRHAGRVVDGGCRGGLRALGAESACPEGQVLAADAWLPPGAGLGFPQ